MKTKISVAEFAKQRGISLTSFISCEEETARTIKEIQGLYEVPPFSPDVDLVAYGSIARKECVPGSDIDWTLLVDGQANPDHLKRASDVKKRLKQAGLKDPGSSGMFGQISFSHELIHHIGGQQDTNHNLSKRILLLLESTSISFNPTISVGGTAYGRIINGIISQYIENDSGLNSDKSAVPRFLLNDVVRFWRTMCVDFAYKQKEQGGEKWALRNIKLRMSRKMLYIKGLLMCLSNYGVKQDKARLCDDLAEMVKYTPIEVLLTLSNHFDLDVNEIKKLLISYDKFLTCLNDSAIRKKLEEMNMEEVYNSRDFIKLRNIADDFQNSVNMLFIEGNNKLSKLVLKYCIF